MKILSLTKNKAGAYGPMQTWAGATPPAGYAVIPDNLDTSAFYAHNGFVTLEVENGVVSKLDTDEAAWGGWQASQPVEEETEPEVSTEELLLEMATDHEARICAMELGV